MSDLHASLRLAPDSELTRSSSRAGLSRKEGLVDRDKMLDVTLQQIEKQFGKGAVMKLGQHPMNAAMPPLACASAMMWSVTVVLPEPSGP